jgi:hypothetical protein
MVLAARSWILAALLLVAGTRAVPATVNASAEVAATLTASPARSFEWKRFDVRIELRDDGTLHVTERQVIAFNGGPYQRGSATIPLRGTEGIRVSGMTEAAKDGSAAYRSVPPDRFVGAPRTYTVTETPEEVTIGWSFEPAQDEERVFLLEYDALGALRVYANNTPPVEQIWWTAIGRDVTSTAPVLASSVAIILPEGVDLDQVDMTVNDERVASRDHSRDGRVFTLTRRNLVAGAELTVRIEFPLVVDVPPPSWQVEDDQRRREEKSQTATPTSP